MILANLISLISHRPSGYLQEVLDFEAYALANGFEVSGLDCVNDKILSMPLSDYGRLQYEAFETYALANGFEVSSRDCVIEQINVLKNI